MTKYISTQVSYKARRRLDNLFPSKHQQSGYQVTSSSGFTIVELLVVIVVIGILAAITIVSYTGITNRAKIASLQSDLSNAAQQLTIYQMDHNVYPASVTDCPNPASQNICLKASNGASYTSYTTTSSSFVLVETTADGKTEYLVTESSGPVIFVPLLTNLTINDGFSNVNLSPSSSSMTYNLSYDTSSVTVTPTADGSQATITVNGTPVPSGQASGAINLNVGANPIAVQVTAADGSTQQAYTINVTRASSPYLTGLKIISGKSQLSLNPTFSNTNLLYSTTVTSTSVNVTPTAEDSIASITVNGTSTSSGQAVLVQINTGVNQINVVVTSSIGNDSKTYVITATK